MRLSVKRDVSVFPHWATVHIETGDWAKEQITELHDFQPFHHVYRQAYLQDYRELGKGEHDSGKRGERREEKTK